MAPASRLGRQVNGVTYGYAQSWNIHRLHPDPPLLAPTSMTIHTIQGCESGRSQQVVGGAADPHWLACTRLSFFFSTTFLSYFRTTTPQISQKFRESSLSVCNTHTQSVSGSTLTIPPPNPHASALLRSIPSLSRVAHLTCDLGSLSQSCGCCSAPVRTGGRLGDRGLFTGRPGPATFAKFRPFATPLQLSEKLSRKSGTGQAGRSQRMRGSGCVLTHRDTTQLTFFGPALSCFDFGPSHFITTRHRDCWGALGQPWSGTV